MLETKKRADPNNFTLEDQEELDELSMTREQATEVLSNIITPETQED